LTVAPIRSIGRPLRIGLQALPHATNNSLTALGLPDKKQQPRMSHGVPHASHYQKQKMNSTFAMFSRQENAVSVGEMKENRAFLRPGEAG
jgi:hypothetical protein